MPQVTCLKCGKICKSLQGWKQHMTGGHGGYNVEDMQAAVGGAPPINARARMDSFAPVATMPTTGEEGPPVTGADAGGSPVAAPIPQPTEKRVRATPKRLKKILGGIPGEILRKQGLELDSDDVEALDEAGEFLADIFGVEFSVPQSKYVVESRFFAILWVVGVTILIYAKHRFSNILEAFKQKPEEEPEKPQPVN